VLPSVATGRDGDLISGSLVWGNFYLPSKYHATLPDELLITLEQGGPISVVWTLPRRGASAGDRMAGSREAMCGTA
jgi:hypothetical protein